MKWVVATRFWSDEIAASQIEHFDLPRMKIAMRRFCQPAASLPET